MIKYPQVFSFKEDIKCFVKAYDLGNKLSVK